MASRKMNPLTWLGTALVVAIALMVILGVLSFSTYGGYYGMMGTGSWGWALLMMGIPAVILIVILIAALGGLRETVMPPASPGYVPPPPNPLESLDGRYARGEVSREEYLRIRDDLTRGIGHA